MPHTYYNGSPISALQQASRHGLHNLIRKDGSAKGIDLKQAKVKKKTYEIIRVRYKLRCGDQVELHVYVKDHNYRHAYTEAIIRAARAVQFTNSEIFFLHNAWSAFAERFGLPDHDCYHIKL